MKNKLTSNWRSNPKELSYPDMINRLLEIKNKLVLAQVHELEKIKRIKSGSKNTRAQDYIKSLYKHYVVDKKPKTYLDK